MQRFATRNSAKLSGTTRKALLSSSRAFSISTLNRNGAISSENEIKVPLSAFNSSTSDPQVKNFFKYTWGTWITNDAAEKAKRETQFSLKGLVDVLRQNLTAADKSVPIEVKTIASLSEGKHHRLYLVHATGISTESAETTVPYVLRIPYPGLGSKEYISQRLKSEVATMDFVKKVIVNGESGPFKVPEVIAWSADASKTPLESQFILSEYVEGTTLMKYWNPASQDMASKQKVIQPVVDAFAALTCRVQFNKYGSLYFTEDSSDQNGLPYDGVQKELADRWRIGPTTESQFWKNTLPADSKLRGPFNTATDYIKATGDILVESIKSSISETQSADVKTSLEKQLDTAIRYAKAAPELLLESELAPELFSPRLCHPDLNPVNFIVPSEVKEIGDLAKPETPLVTLVDYESTSIKPFLLHGTPFFARHDGLKIFSRDEVPDYDKLSDQDKYAVDHFLALSQNQFSFEYLLMQNSELGRECKPMINAFAPIVKRRQRPIHLAMTKDITDASGTSKEYLDVDQDLISLGSPQGEWEAYQIPREYPLKYTPEQLEAHDKAFAEYSKEGVVNPFLFSKGWVPQDMFEKLVADGTITKKDNGDYDVNYKWELNQ